MPGSYEVNPILGLKNSPLVHLLSDIYEMFPGLSHEEVDEDVIASRCDKELTARLLHERVERKLNRKERSDSFATAYASDVCIGISKPASEMKVYRLDAEAPNNTRH
jgi:hypothetical protein